MSRRIKRSSDNRKQVRLNHQQRQDQLALKNIKDKLSDNDAMLCKADKGHTTVVLYTADYSRKVNEFIEGNDITLLTKDPTNTYNRKIKQLINKSKVLFTDEEIRLMKIINPKAPHLRGLPKVHKENMPIRPLVNHTTAPTYKLAKKLESLLKQHITFDKNYSLVNSYDLIEKTRNINIMPHNLLVSFDIVNLYTNIPITPTLEIVEQHLKRSNLLPEAIIEFLSLLKEVTKQNYFEFENKYFVQNDGLAMGSPLSGILADIYLNHVENNFVFSDRNKLSEKIIFYYRYVDDTLLLFNGNTRQLERLHNYLNTISPKLKFTIEIEHSGKINFLDLILTKNKTTFLEYNIFRKPTTSDQTIHATSYHPHHQKMAAYNSMVHRLLKIPLCPDNYSKELNTIKYIARANGYNTAIIDRIIAKKKFKIRKNTDNNDNNDIVNAPKYACVEYSKSIHNGLKNIMSTNNIKMAFRTTNNIGNILKQTKTNNIEKQDKSGVYKIKCSDCSSIYVGQTGRAFKTRYKEHYPDPRTTKQKSSFAQHLIDTNHNMGNIDVGLEVLHVCKKGKLLDTLEEYEIYKHFKQDNSIYVLNDKLNFSSHSIFNAIGLLEHKQNITPDELITANNNTSDSDNRSRIT